jgi:hypothetical protein
MGLWQGSVTVRSLRCDVSMSPQVAESRYDTRFEDPVVDDGFIRVPGHVDHAERWPSFDQLLKVVRSVVAIVDGVLAAGSVFILSVSSGTYPILTRTESPRESFTGPPGQLKRPCAPIHCTTLKRSTNGRAARHRGVLSLFRYTRSISFHLEATVAFKRATTTHLTVSLPLAARRWSDRRRGQEHAFALPRTSRYRSHDEEPDDMSGCLGAPSRHAAADAEPSGEPE